MKIFTKNSALLLLSFLLPLLGIAQTPPPLGASASFVLFTINGPVGNIGSSLITGNVGTNVGSSTGFGNINGEFYDANDSTVAAVAPVNAAYISLGLQPTTNAMPVLIGNGETFVPGVYESLALTVLSGDLFLDGLNNPNACFVIKVNAAMNVGPGARVHLINGAQACNVFWKIGGALNTGTNTTLKGNFICDGAIGLNTGTKLEGRAFSISGAIQVSSTTATAPRGCGSKILIGPALPSLGDAVCFSLLTGVGQLTSNGISHIGGHVGTNNGPVFGFNPLFVDSIHPVPDNMTADGTASIVALHTVLLAMQCEITLTQPTQFGYSQVLTPHVYCLGAATHLTDTIFLDAQGNADAVFVIKIAGAFTTETFANVVLRGGTKSSNVFWVVEGLVTVQGNSNFAGNIVSNNGAITLNDCNLDGRAYSTNGAIIVSDLELVFPNVAPVIQVTGVTTFCEGDSVVLTASLSTTYLWSTGETTQSITVDTSGTFSVIAENECGKADTSNSIDVTVNPIYNTNLNASICEGDSIFLAGQFRKTPGIYTEILTSQFLCDSNINTTLQVNPIYNTNLNASICQGDSIFLAGQFRKTPGIYTEVLTSQFLCDSNINTNLQVNPRFIVDLLAEICEGDSIFIAGQFRKTAGQYSDTLASQFACDSILITDLTVHPLYLLNINQSICDGDSVLIGGIYRKQAGTYIQSFVNQFGCDSTINTTLNINELPIADAGFDTTIVDGQTTSIGSPSEAGFTYSWLPILGLDFSNTAEANASPTTSTTYVLTVVNDLTGCVNTDTVIVTVTPNFDLEFFNGYSPNGDGLNDFWRIPILTLFPSNSVVIINRWGSEVWRISNYDNVDNNWKGKNMNGDDLPDGTYFYTINYSGTEKSGWVFIKR